MSTETIKIITLHCDGEGCSATFGDGQPVKDVEEQRQMAKVEGWLHNSQSKDYCPDCKAKNQEARIKSLREKRKKFTYGNRKTYD